MHNQQHPVGSTEKKISVTQLLLAPLNLQINEYAPESWGGSPEPRRAPSPGCLCSQQDPVRPTRASAAGQGSRPTKLSDIAPKCMRYSSTNSVNQSAKILLDQPETGPTALRNATIESAAIRTVSTRDPVPYQ